MTIGAQRVRVGASGPTSWGSSTSRRIRSPATGCAAEWRSRPVAGRRSSPGRWSRRGPTCSTSAANPRGRVTCRSTRAAEIARVVPVIAAVRAALPGIPLSVDTSKPRWRPPRSMPARTCSTTCWGTRSDRGHGRARGRDAASRSCSCTAGTGPIYDDVVGRGRRGTAARRSSGPRGSASHRTGSSSIRGSGSARPRTTMSDCCASSARSGRSAARSCSGRPASRRSGGSSTCRPTSDSRRPSPRRRSGSPPGVDLVRVHDVGANVRAARVSRRDRPRPLARSAHRRRRALSDRIVLANMQFRAAMATTTTSSSSPSRSRSTSSSCSTSSPPVSTTT